MTRIAVVNAGELVTCSGGSDGLGIVEAGALVAEGGKVVWTGPMKEYRRKTIGEVAKEVDAMGQLVTPGFVDPHSHVVFAGAREDELERKVRGESYISILEHGGGISRTIRETRSASLTRIVDESTGRLRQLVGNGVTTAEVKTGYGQSTKDELKLLAAIDKVGEATGAEVVKTLLGLHATPGEFKRASDYVSYAIREMLPAVVSSRHRPRFSDCFCEEGVFSREDCRRYLNASARLGLGLKIHADEFRDSGGASLAAESGCVSADHLVCSESHGIEAMGKKGVTAVLMPGTSLLSGVKYADAPSIRDSGCAIALGTDLSPNSWIESPQLVMALACSGLKLTPEEALLGFTVNAAKAIGRSDVGNLRVGSSADFVVHTVPGYRFLPYRIGGRYVSKVFKKGREIFAAPGA